MSEKDKCQCCLGEKGGVPGNENVLADGTILCDYCTVEKWNKENSASSYSSNKEDIAKLLQPMLEAAGWKLSLGAIAAVMDALKELSETK